MKHKSSRDLYGYWQERRGHRVAPERADIDPTVIPRVLADTLLLGLDDDLVVRLAGTRVCALFCRELKGENFVALFDPRGHRAVHELIEIVCDEALATVAGVLGEFDDGTTADLELLLLPLSHCGRMDSRILGVLAPLTTPYWLGAVPVATLTLGTLRHLDSVGSIARMVDLQSLGPEGRARRGFVVFDGGRTT